MPVGRPLRLGASVVQALSRRLPPLQAVAAGPSRGARGAPGVKGGPLILSRQMRKRMADRAMRDKYGPCFKQMDVRCGVDPPGGAAASFLPFLAL